jgi:hypothetical protein
VKTLTETVLVKPQTIHERIEKEIRKTRVSRLFATAEKYGIVHKGFTGYEYLRWAIDNHGWESHGICGPKGQAKSNLLLQRGHGILRDFSLVLENMVTKRRDFLRKLKDAIDHDERIPWLGVDDIAVLFPASLYFSDRKVYSSLQSSWEVLRTVINCFDWTATRKNKVASFILEDITGDIICYNRIGELKSHYNYCRWLWLRNLKDPRKMIAKMVTIEDIPFPLIPDALECDKEIHDGRFVVGGEIYHGKDFFRKKAMLTGVERPDFRKYWNVRLGLTKQAFGGFSKLFEDQTVETNLPTPKKPSDSEPEPQMPTTKDAEALQHLAKRKEKEGQ